jgi:aconitate hydratase
MGILPLQFIEGQGAASLGLSGEETFEVSGLTQALNTNFAHTRNVTVRARSGAGLPCEFQAAVRIDTPQEVQYYKNGGILHYVLRQLLAE